MNTSEKYASWSKQNLKFYFIEYMASSNDVHVVSDSNEDTDEIQIISELTVSLEDNHRCDLCCEGEFLVDRLLRFGGLINETYKFVCDKCDKNFVDKFKLKKHSSNCPGLISKQNKTINEENQSKMYSIVCPACKKPFKSQSGLTRHMQWKHSDLTHKCEVCQEVFTEFKKFNNHCFKHLKSKKNILFPCLGCDKEFSSENRLNKHILKHKTNDHQSAYKELIL